MHPHINVFWMYTNWYVSQCLYPKNGDRGCGVATQHLHFCSVDTRDAEFSAAEQWSGGDVLGQRATFRADRHPAVLLLTNVKPKDEGLYRCRVDFRLSQTRNALVNLTVVGKNCLFCI